MSNKFSKFIIVDADESDPYFDSIIELSAPKMGFFPTFSYEFLLTDKNHEYSCSGVSCALDDYYLYFEQVKKISSLTFDELNKDKEHHFHYAVPQKNQMELLLAATGKKRFPAQKTPFVGQFALYTPKEYKEGQKCARIFFFLGKSGVLFILGFDLFHKISPMKKH